MSRIADAYAAHAALDVSGITIKDLDDELSLAEIDRVIKTEPIIYPTSNSDAAPLRTTSTLDTGENTYTARFRCVVHRSGDERGLHIIRPKVVVAIDAYIDALLANPQLRTDPDDPDTKTINGDVVVTISAAEFDEFDPVLVGFEIVHEWLFIIDNRS